MISFLSLFFLWTMICPYGRDYGKCGQVPGMVKICDFTMGKVCHDAKDWYGADCNRTYCWEPPRKPQMQQADGVARDSEALVPEQGGILLRVKTKHPLGEL